MILIAIVGLITAQQAEAKKKNKSVDVTVMTRNVFLGADLGPALEATGTNEFIEANGEILREVDETDFPRRAPILAAEIQKKKPDLVGLQEVALWRTAPPDVGPALSNNPQATTVEYDFLQLLLDELNEGLYDEGSGYEEGAYKVEVVQEEFDFEAPANENGVNGDGPNAFIPNAEINGRLTMRDVILKRVGTHVKTSNATGGNFENVLEVNVAGVVTVPVTRGWTQLDAVATKKVKKKNGKGKKTIEKPFRFTNAHFEAFDDETQRPSIRAQQADELIEKAANEKRSIILGDFNSDSPGVQDGDEQAYEVLLAGGLEAPYETGFRTLADHPESCCVNDLFSAPPSQFDHQVDHVMTNMPGKKAKRVKSGVTGLTQVGGIYGSDHGGVFSKIKLK